MAANNETGALQPVRELAVVAHAYGALIHCDAAQAAGKVRLDVDDLDVDLLTVVGHKMYAPKGVAALYVRDGLDLEPVVVRRRAGGRPACGDRERRPIAALGTASRLATDDLAHGAGSGWQRFATGCSRVWKNAFPVASSSMDLAPRRLPNTLNVSIASVSLTSSSGAGAPRRLHGSAATAAGTGHRRC